jgi:hypothetical protein
MLVKLQLEGFVTNLFDDARIPGLANRECFPAMRANEFVHFYAHARLENFLRNGRSRNDLDQRRQNCRLGAIFPFTRRYLRRVKALGATVIASKKSHFFSKKSPFLALNFCADVRFLKRSGKPQDLKVTKSHATHHLFKQRASSQCTLHDDHIAPAAWQP